MKSKLPLIVVTIIIILITLSTLLFYQNFSVKKPILIPFFAPSPTQSLSKALEDVSIKVDSGPRIEMETIVASISGYKVIFSKDKDIISQVRALQLVQSTVKMNNRVPKVVDVRLVNKVIIRY